MAHVFISHVEEDSDVALRIADRLEESGFRTWCYERNAVPGPSYLLQTGTQVEESSAFLLVISRDSLGSRQVTAEVIRAHESGRPFIPVLVDITHAEFAARQPEWREAVGSATSISLEPGGVEALVPRIVQGLESFGIDRGEAGERPAAVYRVATAPSASAPPAPADSPRRRLILAGGLAVIVVLVGVGFAIAVSSGPETSKTTSVTTASDSDDDAESTSTTPSTTDASEGQTASPPGTPFATSFGSMVVKSASLTQEACPPPGIPGQCLTAGGSDRYLVLVLAPQSGGGAALSQPFLDEAYASSIVHSGGLKAGAFSIYLQESTQTIEIVYGVLPDSARDKDVVLHWASNPPLLIDV